MYTRVYVVLLYYSCITVDSGMMNYDRDHVRKLLTKMEILEVPTSSRRDFTIMRYSD